MGTITKTFKETDGDRKTTWTISISHSDVVTTDGLLPTVASPTIKAKYAKVSGKDYAIIDIYPDFFYRDAQADEDQMMFNSYYAFEGKLAGDTNKTMPCMAWNYSPGWQLFDEYNPTIRTIPIKLSPSYLFLCSAKYAGDGAITDPYSSYTAQYDMGQVNWGTLFNITLNAPPTYTATETMSGVPYPNQASYTATISNATAQCGGNITQSKLTIGDQSVTGTGDGTLTITPNAVGTFTPTVTVTDSRGQITTKKLSTITILPITTSISFLDADRVNAVTGLSDDEGEAAVLTTVIDYTAFSGNYLLTPIISTNPTISTAATWYESWNPDTGFENEVDWTEYAPTANVTLYAKVDGIFDTSSSYIIGVTPTSTYAIGTEKTTNLSQAFYLFYGAPGGHALGLGMKPLTDGVLDIALEPRLLLDTTGYTYTHTTDTVVDTTKTYYTYDSTTDTYTVVESPVDADIATYYERGNEVDTDLYATITALGWESEVIE